MRVSPMRIFLSGPRLIPIEALQGGEGLHHMIVSGIAAERIDMMAETEKVIAVRIEADIWRGPIR